MRKEKGMSCENSAATPARSKTTGGLYAKVKMSVRSANIMVSLLLIALIAATVFLISHAGFTVRFDTDGGSRVESVRVMHSDPVPLPQDPVKEGYRFTGWYTDSAATLPFDETAGVTGSTTLYAGWQQTE